MLKNNRAVSLGLTLILAFILTITFAFAAHIITTSTGGNSYSVDEDVASVYNITVTNTDTVAGNITEVNITIPSTFTFVSASNGTNATGHTFTNTTTVLNWSNSSLVENGTSIYFSFNATPSTPGSYNITVRTSNTTGIINTTNISVTVNDTTQPYFVDFVSPTPVANANLSQSYIPANISINDSYSNISIIRIYLYNSTGLVNNTNVSAVGGLNATGFINFSSTTLPDGIYYLNATANDTAGNENITGPTRTITLDTTAPVITFSCDSTSMLTNVVLTCSCSGAAGGSGIETTSYTVNPSTSIEGSYTTTCTITDYAGNSAVSNFAYTVTSDATSTGGGSAGTPSYTPSTQELAEGYNKVMYKDWKVSFKVGSSSHTFKVEDVTATSAKVSVSSVLQEATLLVGQEKKFDVSGDGYYDLSVVLNSIKTGTLNRADLTLKTINEQIVTAKSPAPAEPAEPTVATDEAVGSPTPITGEVVGGEGGMSTVLWIVLVCAIIAIVIFIVLKNKKKKRLRR